MLGLGLRAPRSVLPPAHHALQAQLWQQWRGGDALKRPTRAAFVDFALALLRHADGLTLPALLATRPLMGGLLNGLAGDPPEVQLQVERRGRGWAWGLPQLLQLHGCWAAQLRHSCSMAKKAASIMASH